MNVVDGKALTTDLVDPALKQLEGVIIPALDAALQKNIALAVEGLQATVAGALTGLGGLLAQTDGDLSRLLDGLDGWTAQAQITIRLTKPKAGM